MIRRLTFLNQSEQRFQGSQTLWLDSLYFFAQGLQLPRVDGLTREPLTTARATGLEYTDKRGNEGRRKRKQESFAAFSPFQRRIRAQYFSRGPCSEER